MTWYGSLSRTVGEVSEGAVLLLLVVVVVVRIESLSKFAVEIWGGGEAVEGLRC